MEQQDGRRERQGRLTPSQRNPGGLPEEDRIRTPSQAEGERDLIDQDLAEKGGSGHSGSEHRVDTQDESQSGVDIVRTPSQAEGDRDTVDKDLEEKFGNG